MEVPTANTQAHVAPEKPKQAPKQQAPASKDGDPGWVPDAQQLVVANKDLNGKVTIKRSYAGTFLAVRGN